MSVIETMGRTCALAATTLKRRDETPSRHPRSAPTPPRGLFPPPRRASWRQAVDALGGERAARRLGAMDRSRHLIDSYSVVVQTPTPYMTRHV